MRTVKGATIDLAGQTFGLLTVVSRLPNDTFGAVYWRCTCRCGQGKAVRASTLRDGRFFTCGKPACRFWEKVYIPEGDSCHEWMGALNDSGYGVLRIDGKTVRAHIFAWTEKHGPVPPGLLLRHTCDVRHCVRDDHLVPGTHQDNVQDMLDRGRAARAEDKRYLTAQQLMNMRDDYLTGSYPHIALVEKYGVCLNTVRRQLKGLVATMRKDS